MSQLPSIPVSGSTVAPFPRDIEVSVQDKARFINEQYLCGMVRRRPAALTWIQVRSFLNEIHYFKLNRLGGYEPIPREPGEIRSVVPLMKPLYRHALGFLNNNEFDVDTEPVSGRADSLYEARRVRNVISNWQDEVHYDRQMDRAFQILLTEGMVALFYWLDRFHQNVLFRPLPASGIFPIPYDAECPDDASGFIYASLVSKSWLELQDRLAEAMVDRQGLPPLRRMAEKATLQSTNPRLDLPMGVSGTSGRFTGAVTLTAWMKETEATPGGEYLFLVGDEVFRHAVGKEARWAMPDGQPPLEFIAFDEFPLSFYPGSLCGAVLPAQFGMNRNATVKERNALLNRPLTFYDEKLVRVNDMGKEQDSMIPMKDVAYRVGTNKPVLHYPMGKVSTDVDQLMGFYSSMGDNSAGLRSGILFGQAEGRVDAGPGMAVLSQNALASYASVGKRINGAQDRFLPRVLDALRMVYPEEKLIRASEADNIGRELVLLKKDIPEKWSALVKVKSRRVITGGRQTLLNILFSLVQMPGADGKPGTRITEEELRQSLRKLDSLPPGIKAHNRPEARIRTRISLLIGDGKKPAVAPADPQNPGDRMRLENHRVAVRMLTEVILDEVFNFYDKVVQKALFQELQFHFDLTRGGTDHPNDFDDALDRMESQQLENVLAAAEAALDTDEGQFLSGGVPQVA